MTLVRNRELVAGAVALIALAVVAAPALAASPTAKKQRGTVGIVYFSSKDCPYCTGVGRLIQGLAKKYPIAVKKLDVDKPRDYALLERIEAVHSEVRLTVPVVMLDETILMGEEEITAKLEPTVRRAAAAGGASMPYLGRADGKDLQAVAAKQRTERPTGERRPPTIGEEWAKIRSLLNRLF